VLLTPTRIYAPDLLELRQMLQDGLHGLAHVTGGGLPGNLPRALPADLGVRVDPRAWPVGSVFRLVASLGQLDGPELRATLNAGIGMVAYLEPGAVDRAHSLLRERGIDSWVIGHVVAADGLEGRYAEVPA
jgi:phosphoribosylformylglycinamidine cyclo-ligase